MKTEDAALGATFVSQARHFLREEYLPRTLRCLELLSEEDIWWRAHGANNSIGNLVLHLCGNVRQWIISGLGGAPDHRERPKEFSETGPIPKADLAAKLQATVREADQVLERLDVSHLLEPRTIQGFHRTGLQALFHVVEHFSQHLGQIIYVTKMKAQVDLKFWNL
jgi:uncharacterized damage-inducible protein DinB